MVWSEIMLFGMRGLRLSVPVDCVFLRQMFQRGGGVQPAARPSFKCFVFLAVATSIPPRMYDVTVGKLPPGASELFFRVPTKTKR